MEPTILKQIGGNWDVVSKIDLWGQIFLLIVLIFYSIFAFLVYKQVGILNETIYTPKAAILKQVALVHLIATLAILAILVAILIV
ncbi:MAG TPA: DUF5657 family protein [Candidatus Nanoarchaeia archaeon]